MVQVAPLLCTWSVKTSQNDGWDWSKFTEFNFKMTDPTSERLDQERRHSHLGARELVGNVAKILFVTR
jgi:hypothetical protein